MEDTDAQLQLKKRARRRLVGAVAFVLLVAVTLPMIMDHEPKPTAQDVEIRIPGQDERPFAPKFASAPDDRPAATPAGPADEPKPAGPESAVAPTASAPTAPTPAPGPAKPENRPKPTASVVDTTPAPKPADRPADKPAVKPADKPADKPAKPADKPAEKPAEKPSAKPGKAPDKPAEKPSEKVADKPAAKDTDADAKRAAAILSGKPAEAPAAKGGEPHVILIGAFANEGNVNNIRNKLGELGIKVYTEPLGSKTRVRAGPFPNRDAAEKALEKMKRIGVTGVVAAK